MTKGEKIAATRQGKPCCFLLNNTCRSDIIEQNKKIVEQIKKCNV